MGGDPPSLRPRAREPGEPGEPGESGEPGEPGELRGDAASVVSPAKSQARRSRSWARASRILCGLRVDAAVRNSIDLFLPMLALPHRSAPDDRESDDRESGGGALPRAARQERRAL